MLKLTLRHPKQSLYSPNTGESEVVKLVMNLEELRRRRNDEILKRFRAGDSLKAYDAQSSWFPPRPLIKKDEKELKRLYIEGLDSNNSKYE